jgi:hypothetical protein
MLAGMAAYPQKNHTDVSNWLVLQGTASAAAVMHQP